MDALTSRPFWSVLRRINQSRRLLHQLHRPSLRPQLLSRPNLTPSQQPPFPLQTPSLASRTQVRTATILASISDNPGAYKKKIRRGRGPNNKGRTAGRGHSGQKARGKPPPGFQGGQKTFEEVHGKRGFENEFTEELGLLNLDRLQSWIDQGRINPNKPITLIELKESGCIRGKIGDGIKLLSRGREVLKTPVHIFVSRASRSAVAAVENAGGTVTTRYYTRFAIDKILRGQMHPIHSRQFMPTAISQLAQLAKYDDGVNPDKAKLNMGDNPDGPDGSTESIIDGGVTFLGNHTVLPPRKLFFDLPDPTRRKFIEYYRNIAVRGYLNYQVTPGHTHSLYFQTPGLHKKIAPTKDQIAAKKAEKQEQEEMLW